MFRVKLLMKKRFVTKLRPRRVKTLVLMVAFIKLLRTRMISMANRVRLIFLLLKIVLWVRLQELLRLDRGLLLKVRIRVPRRPFLIKLLITLGRRVTFLVVILKP